MKQNLSPEIVKQRESPPTVPYLPDAPIGLFRLWCPIVGRTLTVVASDGREWEAEHEAGSEPWEHVSVSVPFTKQCPNWAEMCWVKDQFWEPEECVIQYHPPKSEYVNIHPFTLHLWRPTATPLPMPPKRCV